MKDQILSLCIQYLKEGTDPEITLDKICAILIPKKEVSNKFLRDLIAFIYNVEPEDLLTTRTGEKLEVISMPRVLYRKLMYDKYNNYTIAGKKCNVSHSTIVRSIKVHKKLLQTNERYQTIYWAIETILTEAL